MNTYKGIDYLRVNNDVNGNPRYVVHFLSIADNYDEAVKLAKQIGGKKYRGKDFGGGIVFQSYNIENTLSGIAISRAEFNKLKQQL